MDNNLQDQLIQSFNKVREKLCILALHTHTELINLPCWLGVGDSFIQEVVPNEKLSPRDFAVNALDSFKYDAHQTAQETFSCPAVIAATSDTLALIDAVNGAKDGFMEGVMHIREALGRAATKSIQDALAKQGEGIIKLRQVYPTFITIEKIFRIKTLL
jgi:hypothetical protein